MHLKSEYIYKILKYYSLSHYYFIKIYIQNYKNSKNGTPTDMCN